MAFLSCILAGVVPVAANTMLTAKDFDFMLRDSRASGLTVSQSLWPAFEGSVGAIALLHTVIVAGADPVAAQLSFSQLVRARRATNAASPLKQHQPTIFYGVPTLYAALLNARAR